MDTIFLPRWQHLDDAALLAHWRSPRDVHLALAVDPDECPPARLAGLLRGEWEFNGETHACGEQPPWLHNPSADVEWHILLHKFYYAPGLGQAYLDTGDANIARRWAALTDAWIAQVPPGFIANDVTGRRVQNWLTALGAFADHRAPHTAPLDPAFFRRLLHSLHDQVEHLCAHLTPKRNHRTLELHAIFLAGVALPEMARAAHWRDFALQETLANLRADLLPDGVHCELSTDYHHLALRNWLNVREQAQRHGHPVPPEMDGHLARALRFAMQVHQPSGDVPSFSDGDVRSYTALLARGAALLDDPELQWVATGGREGRAPQGRLAHFPQAGYSVLRSGWGDCGNGEPGPDGVAPTAYADEQHLVFDTGPVGEGNHGHFDALSFELAANGQALVVDPGRGTYSEAGPVNWRVHFRHTAAHNTVCVDGLPQTRYEPKPVKDASRHATGTVRHRIAGPGPDTQLLEQVQLDLGPGHSLDLLHGRCASHAYDAVHERCIVFVDRRYWIVSDWLRAPTVHDYRLNLQLSAGAQDQVRWQAGPAPTPGAQDAGSGTLLQLDSPGLRLLGAPRLGQAWSLEPGWVAPRYGHREAAPRLQALARAANADFDTVLLPAAARGGPVPEARLHLETATSDEGWLATVLCLALEVEGRPVVDRWLRVRGSSEPRSPWSIGPRRFRGRWAHWRTDADGHVLHVATHPGAEFQA